MLKRNESIVVRKMRQYLLPGVMLTAALQIGNIVDSMLVGNLLGPNSMSAVKIGMAVNNIVGIPGCVLGVGGSIAAGIFMGRREQEKAKGVFSATLTAGVLLGLLFAAFSTNAENYARWLCGDSPLTDDVRRFVSTTLLISPIFGIALQMINYVTVDNNPKLASAYVIVANALNLTFDYILLKYTSLGTAGAALSTGIGYGLALLLLVSYAKSKNRMLSLVNPFRKMGSRLLAALKAGTPTLLSLLSLVVKDILINSLIVRETGEATMVIYAVCFNAVLCVQMFAGGIVGLFSSMGSVLYGKDDFFGIKSLIKHLLRYSFVVLGTFMLVMLAKPDIFLRLFGITDPQVILSGSAALRLNMLSLPIYMWNHFLMMYYQSTGKPALSGLITSLQTCVAIVPAIFACVYIAKACGTDLTNAVILAFVFSESATLLVTLVYRKIKWKGQNVFLIPKQDDGTREFTVSGSQAEIDEASDEILAFLGSLKTPDDTAKTVAGAFVEMLLGIFKKGNARHADVSIRAANGALLLRLTDDGVPFNPLGRNREDGQGKKTETLKAIASRSENLRVIDLNYTSIEIKADNKSS